jgi:hypothetical protein
VSASWSQTTDEVQLRVPVDSSVRGRDVAFEVHPLRLKLAVGGSTLLEGRLEEAGSIRADGAWLGGARQWDGAAEHGLVHSSMWCGQR